MSDDTPQKLEIDWLKTVGGALAAVSSAVLLSTLGAAGTIIGAALGSVIVTVGGALYSQGLVRSRQRLAQAQTAALRKVGVAQAEVRRAGRNQRDGRPVDAQLANAESTLDRARDDLGALSDEPARPGWRSRFGALPWKRTALGAVALFAAVVVALTTFELAAGRSVSSITGGSSGSDGPTIGRLVGGGTGTSPDDGDVTPSDQPSPSGRPSDEPTSPVTPSGSPTTTPDSSPDPSPSGSTSPSAEPTTPAPTPSTTPTDPGLVPPAATPSAG